MPKASRFRIPVWVQLINWTALVVIVFMGVVEDVPSIFDGQSGNPALSFALPLVLVDPMVSAFLPLAAVATFFVGILLIVAVNLAVGAVRRKKTDPAALTVGEDFPDGAILETGAGSEAGVGAILLAWFLPVVAISMVVLNAADNASVSPRKNPAVRLAEFFEARPELVADKTSRGATLRGFDDSLYWMRHDGMLTVWYENGTVRSQRTREGFETQWHPSGGKASEVRYVGKSILSIDRSMRVQLSDFYNRAWEKDGLETAWYANGQKQRETRRVNGRREGLSTEWYENGKKKDETNYAHGREEGLSTEWYENGKKKDENNYVNARIEGISTFWHRNGIKNWETHYANGERHGPVLRWYRNGQKRSEGNYVRGKKHGLETHWDQNGQKQYVERWRNGTRL